MRAIKDWKWWLAMLLVGWAACSHAAAPDGGGVAWRPASSDAAVDRAFALAAAEHKPLLLYWGASWCPPCNQLKATLFNRRDFIERSRSFVTVHVDGDQPGAQKLGARFHVSGYPTMVLFDPRGVEITRALGSIDAAQAQQLLQQGLSGGRPAQQVLADARAGQPLSDNEWRMLAFYNRDEDGDGHDVKRAALLAELASRCPATLAQAKTRLLLRALAEGAPPAALPADAAARVEALLVDAQAARVQFDLLSGAATDIVATLSAHDAARRTALTTAFDRALQRLQDDATLSRADRLDALTARVELARSGQPADALAPQLPSVLVQQVRDAAERADREIDDGYERQAVITSAAYALTRAGLWAQSDALLKADLARSHSPYYLMSQLGSNARRQGRSAEALKWYGQAYARSEGPATRLQWGASYLGALIDLTPADRKGIEDTAAALIAEAAAQPNAFYERSAKSLQRATRKLGGWNTDAERARVVQRLSRQLDAVCRRLDGADPQRATCEGLLPKMTAASAVQGKG